MPNGVCGYLLVSEGANWCRGCLLVSVGAYGFLMVPTGVSWQMLVSEGAKWCRMVSVVAYGCLIVSEGSFWFLSVPTGV